MTCHLNCQSDKPRVTSGKCYASMPGTAKQSRYAGGLKFPINNKALMEVGPKHVILRKEWGCRP